MRHLLHILMFTLFIIEFLLNFENIYCNEDITSTSELKLQDASKPGTGNSILSCVSKCFQMKSDNKEAASCQYNTQTLKNSHIVPPSADIYSTKRNKYLVYRKSAVTFDEAFKVCQLYDMSLGTMDHGVEFFNFIMSVHSRDGFKNDNSVKINAWVAEKVRYVSSKEAKLIDSHDFANIEIDSTISATRNDRLCAYVDEQSKRSLGFFATFCNMKKHAICKEDAKDIIRQIGNGKYLLTGRSNYNWTQATSYCKSLGYKLVSIETHQELQEICTIFEKYLDLSNSKYFEEDKKYVWTSGADVIKENNFVWTGTKKKFSNVTWWLQGEPDNGRRTRRSPENCVALVNKFLTDERCNSKFSALCEA